MSTLHGIDLSASLTVADLQRSVGWYCDVLGFDVDRKYERDGVLQAVSLQAGGVRLLLTQDDGAKGADRVKGAGFSMQITTGQDIDELATRIRAAGGAFITEPTDTPWGVRIFRLRDPDGFLFTISSPRP
jgi:uncharacterized glyoxalase superfamily protein PhnB